MSQLSQLADALVGSEIIRLGNEISARVRQGEKIYNYTIGDFDPRLFPIPAALKAAIIAAYDEDLTNYPPADGILELRTSISRFIKERQGLDFGTSEIQIASGGRPLIYTLFRTLLDQEDKVVYTVPSWNNNHYVQINHGRHAVIEAGAEQHFMPSVEDIRRQIPNATLLCLCAPQNPTGTTLEAEKLREICELVVKENRRRPEGAKKLYVLYDQIYWLLTYKGRRHVDPVSLVPAMKEYTIYIDGMSKGFAATGLRIGWAMGPAEVIAKMKSLLGHIGAWAPTPEQHGTARFLSDAPAVDEYLNGFRERLSQLLDRLHAGFRELKQEGFAVDAIPAEGGIYLTVKFDLRGLRAGDKKLESQKDVTSYLLNEAKLAVMPFTAFGARSDSPWYRLSVGTCVAEDIPLMFSQLRAALEKLSG